MKWNIKNLITGSFLGRNLEKSDARKYYGKQAIQRTRQDVSKWRESLVDAESEYYPNRYKMLSMFYDTINNGHVQAVMNKRRSMTLLKDWCIYTNGEENEALTEQLSKKWFKRLMAYGFDSIFYGYSLINIVEIENSEPKIIKNIPRQFIEPEGEQLLQIPNTPIGMKWEGTELEEFLMFITTESETGTTEVGLGLLYPIAYYEITIRNLTGYNADFIEKFGMPLVKGKTSKMDEARDEFEESVANMGSNAYIITDELGDDVEFLESLGSTTGNGHMSYDNFETRMQKYITKLVLGHADAMDSQSGKLGSQQGEDNPIQKALEIVEEMDNEFVETFMNDIVLPKLRALGVSIPEDAKLYFKNDREDERYNERKNEERKTVSDYVDKMVKAGFDFDETELSEMFDMTIVKAQSQQSTEF
jgi:hypothetical protein